MNTVQLKRCIRSTISCTRLNRSNLMQQASFRHLLLLVGIWGCYVVGAICGSALELRMALSALAFPLLVLAVLIVLDLFRPLQQPGASISHG